MEILAIYVSVAYTYTLRARLRPLCILCIHMIDLLLLHLELWDHIMVLDDLPDPIHGSGDIHHGFGPQEVASRGLLVILGSSLGATTSTSTRGLRIWSTCTYEHRGCSSVHRQSMCSGHPSCLRDGHLEMSPSGVMIWIMDLTSHPEISGS